MKLNEWLDQWSMSSLKINAAFMQMEWRPNDRDKDAAWELYIELLTRIATQYLEPDEGEEESALKSIHELFGITREIIKRNGRYCILFTKIAIIVLNQKVRPFTAKWHPKSKRGEFSVLAVRDEFRKELKLLQEDLRIYAKMLADMAKVEDITDLESKNL